MQSLSELAALRILSQVEGLLSGEDQLYNWLEVVNAANGYLNFRPLTVGDTATYGAVNGLVGQLVGMAGGASGDMLSKVLISVASTSASRVMLQDGNVPTISSSGTGTAFINATSINFGTGSTALTATQALAYVGQFLIGTFTVSGTSVLLARKIQAATATAGTAGNLYTVLTVDTLSVAGVAATAMSTTASQACIQSLVEILPVGSSGSDCLTLDIRSINGGWRIFTDSGVSVTLIGRFS